MSTIHLKIEEFHRIWLKPCDPARFFLVVEPAPERDYAYVRFADLEVGDRILYGGDYDEEMKQEIQVLRPRTILEIREQAAEAGQPERELILLAQNGKIYTFDFYANQRVYTALK
ncbi:MAG TPA: hypothetical protein VNV63_01595 [Nitrospiria bacterium]|nr:hypothetical protein [Nitrospiria bacterium]